jgi:twitching motility two-component system response regulator PilG
LQPEALPNLHPWIDGNNSIRRLSRYTRQSISHVAALVYSAMVTGTVSISPVVSAPLTSGDEPAPKILCIDDSPTICRAVEYILNNNGYHVTAISSPVKALGLIFQHKPNLILCDIAMPEIDGYELCAMLRKSTSFAQVPVIMLTGKDGFIDRVKARMVGANEYLTKPFGEKELLTMVKKYLYQNRNTSNLSDKGNLTDRPPLGMLGMY